ncbi:nuclear transport factor 2 family protein [Pseudonocardia sp. HH130630-07]|uniref:nuclear transport factor 2 family protein n=1 Tax=Pseudonocardia sp. HH130630-07 TaxID=1690815 RepID=UPI0018D3D77F|nr:nuclear transport factor 2 family protein [Pseudonocardia sp. HH130630-07]
MTDIDVADAVGIQALYARYAHAIDGGDGETWADCYTADGTYWSSTFGTRSGRDALREFAVAHFEEWREQGITTQHWINQSRFEPTSWGISGRTYVLLMGARESGPPVAMLQTEYHDELVRDAGRWRLRRRASHAQCRLVVPPVSP